MKVLIGTKNKGKVAGAKEAFEKYFENVEVNAVDVSSNVAEQPVNADIYLGALNRVNNLVDYALANGIKYDFVVAIESGITNSLGKWIIINVAVIKDSLGFESWGTSAGFPVPDKYVEEIITNGLGAVMDNIFQKNDLRSSVGGISYLTHDKINRIDLTRDAFVMALTQVINNGVWR